MSSVPPPARPSSSSPPPSQSGKHRSTHKTHKHSKSLQTNQSVPENKRKAAKSYYQQKSTDHPKQAPYPSSHKGSKDSSQELKPDEQPLQGTVRKHLEQLKREKAAAAKVRAEELERAKVELLVMDCEGEHLKREKSSKQIDEMSVETIKQGLGDKIKAFREMAIGVWNATGDSARKNQQKAIIEQQHLIEQTNRPMGTAAVIIPQTASGENVYEEEDLKNDATSIMEPPPNVEPMESADIVVMFVGLTGAGKSSACNMLCKGNSFVVSDAVKSLTKEFQSSSVELKDKRTLAVIDTMGLCDTNDTEEITRIKITEALWHAKDGVDIIIFCMKQGKLGQLEYEAFETMFFSIFGRECRHYLLLMLTNVTADQVMDSKAGNNWLIEQMAGEDDANQRMRYINEMCLSHIVMVNNLPPSKIPIFEKQNEVIRKKSRENLLKMILSMSEKNKHARFVPSMARKAQELYDEQQKRLLEFERQKEKQLQAEFERLQSEQKAKELEAELLMKTKAAKAQEADYRAKLLQEKMDHQKELYEVKANLERLEEDKKLIELEQEKELKIKAFLDEQIKLLQSKKKARCAIM